MNSELDLIIFKSRCDFLTDFFSLYREGLVELNVCDIKNYHNFYITPEVMVDLKLLCEEVYLYLKINKKKTQYKNILGLSGLSILYNTLDNTNGLSKESKISINQSIFEIFNVVNFLIGLFSNIEDSQSKIERLNYQLYLIFKMIEKSFNGYLFEVLPIISQYFNDLLKVFWSKRWACSEFLGYL